MCFSIKLFTGCVAFAACVMLSRTPVQAQPHNKGPVVPVFQNKMVLPAVPLPVAQNKLIMPVQNKQGLPALQNKKAAVVQNQPVGPAMPKQQVPANAQPNVVLQVVQPNIIRVQNQPMVQNDQQGQNQPNGQN